MDLSSTSPTSSSPLSLSRSMPEVPGASLSGSFTTHNGFAVGAPSVDSVTPTALNVISTSPGTTPPSSPEKSKIHPVVTQEYLTNTHRPRHEQLLRHMTTAIKKTEEKARLKENFERQGQLRQQKYEEDMRQLQEKFEKDQREAQAKFKQEKHTIKEARHVAIDQSKKAGQVNQISNHLSARSQVLLSLLDMLRIELRETDQSFTNSMQTMKTQVQARLREATSKATVFPEDVSTHTEILGQLYCLDQRASAYFQANIYLKLDLSNVAPYAKECLNQRRQELKGELESINKRLPADSASRDVSVIRKFIESCQKRISQSFMEFSTTKKFGKDQDEPSNPLVDNVFQGADIPNLHSALQVFNQFMQQFHALRALLDVEGKIQIPLSKEMIEKQEAELNKLQKTWDEKYSALLTSIDEERERIATESLQLKEKQTELNKVYEDMNTAIQASKKTQPAPIEKKGGIFGIFGGN